MPRSIVATSCVVSLGLLLAAGSTVAAQQAAPPAVSPDKVVDTITFGSCANQDAEQPIWDSIVDADSDVFVWLGPEITLEIRDVDGAVAMTQSLRLSELQPA